MKQRCKNKKYKNLRVEKNTTFLNRNEKCVEIYSRTYTWEKFTYLVGVYSYPHWSVNTFLLNLFAGYNLNKGVGHCNQH